MVKRTLDYTAIIWSPHTQKDINTIKRSQRQAARYAMNNFSTYASVTQMLTNLNWPTLAKCRQEQKVIMMFKIVNGLVDIPAHSILLSTSMLHNTRSHKKRFTQPLARIDSYQFSSNPWEIMSFRLDIH